MAGPNSNLPSWAQNTSTSAQASGQDPNLPSWASSAPGSTPAGSLPDYGTPIVTKKKSGGGVFGALRKAAHFTADKAGRAAHDIKSIPGGVGQLAVDEYKSVSKPVSLHQLVHEWEHPLSEQTPIAKDVKAQAKGTEETLQHPLRDPFQTLLTVSPAAHGLGKIGDVAVGLKTGTRLTETPRFIRQGEDATSLHGSTNPVVRAGQAGYDAILQHGLDTNPAGRIASHAEKRIGGAKAETLRRQQHMREVPASQIETAGQKLGGNVAKRNIRTPGGFSNRKIQQAALRLTSENATGAEAAAYHLGQAAKGVAVKANRRQAALFQAVHDSGILHQDEHGNVHVNVEQYPHLAAVDAKIAAGQGHVDQIIAAYGHRSPEALQTRIDAPNRYRAGAEYVEPTPAKNGVISPALERQRSDVTRLEKLHARAVEGAKSPDRFPKRQALKGDESQMGTLIIGDGKIRPAPGAVRAERLGAALSVAREKLDRMEQARYRRMEPTGIVGGDGARPGRNYLSNETSEPKPSGPIASAQGSVVGKTRPFVRDKALTYEAASEGRIPDNTTHLVAQNMRDAYRYVNTDHFRRDVIGTGSDVKRSGRDVLVAIPDEAQAPLTEADKLAVGKAHSTEDQLGEAAGYQAYLHDLIPGLRDPSLDAKSIGTEAPKGYKWVSKNVLGDLAKPVPGASSVFGRSADNVNASVTAATVYFKLGHVGTRVLTNAATTIMQGSADPIELGKSVKLWKSLSDTERQRAIAAAGQKGFEALPAEGSSRAARVARVGARWWAKHADAPFRFASIAFEARKAGFDTPEKFRGFLDQLENPHGLDAAQTAKIDWVAKRADRAGIAYDRLNSTEKRFITRGVWFYPWVKGSTLFTGHTIIEHPYKSAVLGSAAQQGEQRQEKILGKLPSYDQGLIPLGHGNHPTVTDLSTFSPFATGADVVHAATHPKELSGFLNPVYGAGLGLITGTNQYGQKTNTPVTDAASAIVSPAPETQILTAYLHRHDNQSKRQFKHTVLNQTARALLGPATPRRLNKLAANKAAGLETKGR